MRRHPKPGTLGRPDVEVIERAAAYEGYFRIDRYRLRHRLHDGGWSRVVVRECFERRHAAALLPYDPDRDQVVLLEQFRIGAFSAGWSPWVVEIPAGVIEPGETGAEVARRETREETGCEVGPMVLICNYLSTPGGASETVSLYCGRVDTGRVGGVFGNRDEVEDILVYAVPWPEARRRLDEGRFENSVTVIALQWLALNRERLRAQWS